MHIAPEKCKWKLGSKRPIQGKPVKNTFHTTEKWHSFTTGMYPAGIQHQVVFHRLFYTQGRMGWIILVFLEVPGDKGYMQAGEDGSPWAHPQSMTWPYIMKSTLMGLFIPITETDAEMANHRKGRRNSGKSGHLSSAQRGREWRSITLSLFWGKGQMWFAIQLDSCKPPFQKQFSVLFVCSFVCLGMYCCAGEQHSL